MEELLPENAGDLCSERVSITITQVRPWFIPFRRREVTEYELVVEPPFFGILSYTLSVWQITVFKTKEEVIQVSIVVIDLIVCLMLESRSLGHAVLTIGGYQSSTSVF